MITPESSPSQEFGGLVPLNYRLRDAARMCLAATFQERFPLTLSEMDTSVVAAAGGNGPPGGLGHLRVTKKLAQQFVLRSPTEAVDALDTSGS